MTQQDKTCVCRDCQEKFTFTAEEQKAYRAKGYNPPTRCPECHDKRTHRRRHTRGGDSEMSIAPCSVCGKDAEVPFKPTTGKPIYCAECFQSQLRDKAIAKRKDFVLQKPVAPKPEPAEAENMASFDDFELDSRLSRAVHDSGYTIPTPVQLATIPLGLAGGDLIGTAQTGTGKTAAFALPILQRLLANPSTKPCTRAIILTPTRELAEQISDSFKQLGKHTKIRVATVYGGVGMVPQERALRGGADVIVACPGRLLDHMERGNTDFSGVSVVVLDEADRMLDMGFLPPIKRILARLPKDRQSMLFSATFAPELMKLVADSLKDPKRVDVDLRAPAKTVAHALYPCPEYLKTSLVLKLLEQTDTNSVLIFTRTKHRANTVAMQIEKAGYRTAALHANKSQNQRQLALDDFKSGRSQILVATDIAARGIDVETISHVINYDVPDTADTYIHRIGRTGRAEREGDAITFVTTKDGEIIWEIEKALGSQIDRVKVDGFDYAAPAPPKDEFKRGPAPRRNPRPDAAQAKASPRLRHEIPPHPKKAPKSPGYFAQQRQARANKSGGY